MINCKALFFQNQLIIFTTCSSSISISIQLFYFHFVILFDVLFLEQWGGGGGGYGVLLYRRRYFHFLFMFCVTRHKRRRWFDIFTTNLEFIDFYRCVLISMFYLKLCSKYGLIILIYLIKKVWLKMSKYTHHHAAVFLMTFLR